MASWRDTASAATQEDLDALFELVLRFAEQMLGEHGEFFPFGASISNDGDASLMAAGPDSGEAPRPDQLLATLYEGARANAAAMRAVAFVTDVHADGSDAVRVELEDLDGMALVVLVPYTRNGPETEPVLEEMRVTTAEPKIWAAAS